MVRKWDVCGSPKFRQIEFLRWCIEHLDTTKIIQNEIWPIFYSIFISKETFLFSRYSICHATCKKFKFSRVFWCQVSKLRRVSSWDEWAASLKCQKHAEFERLKHSMKNWISADRKCFFWNWFGCSMKNNSLHWSELFYSFMNKFLLKIGPKFVRPTDTSYFNHFWKFFCKQSYLM